MTTVAPARRPRLLVQHRALALTLLALFAVVVFVGMAIRAQTAHADAVSGQHSRELELMLQADFSVLVLYLAVLQTVVLAVTLQVRRRARTIARWIATSSAVGAVGYIFVIAPSSLGLKLGTILAVLGYLAVAFADATGDDQRPYVRTEAVQEALSNTDMAEHLARDIIGEIDRGSRRLTTPDPLAMEALLLACEARARIERDEPLGALDEIALELAAKARADKGRQHAPTPAPAVAPSTSHREALPTAHRPAWVPYIPAFIAGAVVGTTLVGRRR